MDKHDTIGADLMNPLRERHRGKSVFNHERHESYKIVAVPTALTAIAVAPSVFEPQLVSRACDKNDGSQTRR
jgi:hypothetical protein